ncbi:hypothetical protein HYW87_02345 [Candidatus Roizmanbacteria bacterium]|nr:hypothetical protein [Candidatus Roizmanbacteria bacterium]
MGKIRTRVLGLEDVEKKQKAEQKQRAVEKKHKKGQATKVHLPGMKGGERLKAVEADEKSLEKMEKAKKLLEEKPFDSAQGKPSESKRKRKVKARLRGINYRKATKFVDKKKMYPLKDAIELLKKMKFAKFDESVELHLNVDKSGLKGESELPHSTGKTFRVKIVDEDVLAAIEKGKIDFDMLVTHPSFMPKLARFAKVLGPRGLMPNPKAGTISDKPQEVVKRFEKGSMKWKTEAKAPLIHQMIGKVSFEDKKLQENADVFLKSVGSQHIKTAFIKTTMSPSVRIDLDKT